MTTESIPGPPWVLHGDAFALLTPRFQIRMLVNYHDSPVGPYLEHALGAFTKDGPSVVQMSVNLEASRQGGRAIWGYPKVLEHLDWQQSEGFVLFTKENSRFRIRKFGPKFPIALPFWTVQNLNGELVRVPGSIKSLARLGWRGRQLVLALEGFEITIQPPQPL